MTDPVEFTPDCEADTERRGDYVFLTVSAVFFVVCWTAALMSGML